MSKSREYKAESLERNIVFQGRFQGETPGEVLGRVREHLVRMINNGKAHENEKFKVSIFKKRNELVKGKSKVADAWTIKAKGPKRVERTA